MTTDSIVIVNGARTPMGGLQGAFADVSAPELAAVAISSAISRAGIEPNNVDEVFMGCVLPAGVKQAPARQAALGAGIPNTAGAVTINKVCGSGMQAAMFGADTLRAGSADVVVCGGMESMSNAPHMIANARSGVRTGHAQLRDHMFTDGLEDAYTGRAMGSFAQETADAHNLTREEMDAFAIESLSRAKAAIEDGRMAGEIAAVTVKSRRGETVVEHDEQPFAANIEKIPNLRPAFAKDGTITAANASSISDGASALVMMRQSDASALGLKPMARLVAQSRNSQQPAEFTLAPIGAIEKVLAKAHWTTDEVDLFEINEAFAMVTMLAMRGLNLDHSKVNVHGGACALGHPLGSTGSRLIVSLMYQLAHYGKSRGVAALCIGGGEATAVAIERFV